MPEPPQDLAAQIPECMHADQFRLRQRLRGLKGSKQHKAEGFERLHAAIMASQQKVALRAENRPAITYPDELPVCAQREPISDAIRRHQVVIIAGETGSGKTTQIPKICLELGRGTKGFIGHTQPRRIAARSVAKRIAEELQTELGQHVGYKIRFKDHVKPVSYIKLMTDGILLAETHSDRFLEQYDTIIIDEAHERSLNIDFLLGYIKRILPKRPDLKLIITSATIDPQRFSKHFNDAPIIEVSGRTYPVELRYRPLPETNDDEGARDMTQAILDAVDELGREGRGDILIFLSGEREIRETAEALRKHHPPQTEILSLYARLSAAEQNRVFAAHKNRRIVLATNVAETSLTVPGIRYVIDPGTARISRYSYRTKVQRLPIEKIAQASANQRKGRCGRVSAGICIRLYSEEDFADRPEFTEPEILRTNLASVILQMQALGLGDIEDFPFVEPPDSRYIKDGLHLLEELQALEQGRINKMGRAIAKLPLDPRLARMIIAASEFHCLKEVLIITSALSIQDPRERPLDKQQQADEARAQFADEKSDFMTLVKLWDFYQAQRKHLSTSKLRQLCRQGFLSYNRMEEWRDIHAQLHGTVTDMQLRENSDAADVNNVHQALLSGLLANIGLKGEGYEYLGARNSKFAIFPGSGLQKKQPKWIMAASLMETSRLYAHTVAQIQPEWVETLAAHVVKRSYSEAHWEKRAAQVAAFEKISLYGLVINPKRRVNFGPLDPRQSREIFIREALVRQQFHCQAAFFKHNQQLIAEVEELEAKSRRQDILIDEETIYQFYDERIPADIYSGKHFDTWRKQAEQKDARLLFLDKEYLMQHGAEHITQEQFPTQLNINGTVIKLGYHFEPGHEEDGVTAEIPLAALNHLPVQRFEWLIPSLLPDKLSQLIKSLPKQLRRNFVPAPDYAHACLQAMHVENRSLVTELAAQLRRMSGIDIPANAWQMEQLPPHLFMNFKVVDDKGKVLGMGRDLHALQEQLGQRASQTFSSLAAWDIERSGMTDWEVDEIPAFIETEQHGVRMRGFPALVDEQGSVALRVFDNAQQAGHAHRAGVRRLFMLRLAQQVKYLQKNLPGIKEICLYYAPVGQCDAIRQDIIHTAFDYSFLNSGEPIVNKQQFSHRLEQNKARLLETANQLCDNIKATLKAFHSIRKQINGRIPPAWLPACQDIQMQLDHLITAHFICHTPRQWLQQLPRYLKAIELRLEKLNGAVERDRRQMLELKPLWDNYCRQADSDEVSSNEDFIEYRWMLEELRVSLFAQELKTLKPVSVPRLEKLWKKVSGN